MKLPQATEAASWYFKDLPEDPVPVLLQRFGQVFGHFSVIRALYLLLSQ